MDLVDSGEYKQISARVDIALSVGLRDARDMKSRVGKLHLVSKTHWHHALKHVRL